MICWCHYAKNNPCLLSAKPFSKIEDGRKRKQKEKEHPDTPRQPQKDLTLYQSAADIRANAMPCKPIPDVPSIPTPITEYQHALIQKPVHTS